MTFITPYPSDLVVSPVAWLEASWRVLDEGVLFFTTNRCVLPFAAAGGPIQALHVAV